MGDTDSILHCCNSDPYIQQCPGVVLYDDPSPSENIVKSYRWTSPAICCLPYLVKLQPVVIIFWVLNNYHSNYHLSNPPAAVPLNIHYIHQVSYCLPEFLNQNYLGSSLIFGKLPNNICMLRNTICYSWQINSWDSHKTVYFLVKSSQWLFPRTQNFLLCYARKFVVFVLLYTLSNFYRKRLAMPMNAMLL